MSEDNFKILLGQTVWLKFGKFARENDISPEFNTPEVMALKKKLKRELQEHLKVGMKTNEYSKIAEKFTKKLFKEIKKVKIDKKEQIRRKKVIQDFWKGFSKEELEALKIYENSDMFWVDGVNIDLEEGL